MDPAQLHGFLDELGKVAASHGRMKLPKERKGRRPMSVTTLLRREKDGTLYKEADAQGGPQPVRGSGADDPGSATLPKRRGETPTCGPMVEQGEKTGRFITRAELLEEARRAMNPPSKKNDPNHVDRMDGRGEATTITGLAQRSADIGIGGGEHY